MRYLSVCAGIEAASSAWHELGWRPVAFSEIEPFPISVLEAHYPGVPNLGDMTKYREWPALELDLLVGGTPCQAFSVAGKRESLDDERGNLTLVFCRIADRFDPELVLWENVPGVLSTEDNAFGCFLGALVGEDSAIVPPGGRWTDAGVVAGPKRTAAWRVIDAQGFVPQRRERVFVVAARSGSRVHPADVLFETEAEALECLGARAYTGPLFPVAEGVRGNPEARGEAGEDIAPCLRSGSTSSRAHGKVNGTDRAALVVERGADRVMAFVGNNTSGEIEVATAVRAHGSAHQDFESETFVAGTLQASGKAAGSATQQDAESGLLVIETAHALRAEGFDASEDGTGRGTPLVPVLAGTLEANYGKRSHDEQGTYIPAVADPLVCKEGETWTHEGENFRVRNVIAFDTSQITHPENRANPKPGDPAPSLLKDGHPLTIAFSCKDHGGDAGEIAPTLRSMSHDGSHANAGGQVAIAIPINADALRGEGTAATPSPDAEGRVRLRDPGLGIGQDGDPAGTIAAAGPGAVAYGIVDDESAEEERVGTICTPSSSGGGHPPAAAYTEHVERSGMQVRRLTPTECERLQDFRDGYTLVTYRGKPAKDGPRYKALGNSMCRAVMHWIGVRIDALRRAA